jgi:hypothetical protein
MKKHFSIFGTFLTALLVHRICGGSFPIAAANWLERPTMSRAEHASETMYLTPKAELQIAQGSSAPRIVSLWPPVGPIGSLVTIHGSYFTAINFVRFRGARADFNAGSPVASKTGDTLQFQVSPCSSSQPQCPTFYVSPGEYSVIVTNENGTSNESKFMITPP